MVKIDFDQKFLNLNGKPLMPPPDPANPKGKPEPLRLKDVAVTALLNPQIQEKEGKKKLERWQNAKVINKGGKISFTVETIAELKRLINEAYPSPLVVGQAFLMLDSGEEEDVKKKGAKRTKKP